MINEDTFLNLINLFMERQMDVETFCDRFTKVWMRYRDAVSAKQLTWTERYDLKVQDDLKRGEITKEGFRVKLG